MGMIRIKTMKKETHLDMVVIIFILEDWNIVKLRVLGKSLSIFFIL